MGAAEPIGLHNPLEGEAVSSTPLRQSGFRRMPGAWGGSRHTRLGFPRKRDRPGSVNSA